ncbi:AP-5 complex subunit beta-1 [Carya illinoinensis]|uniref:AP-5 complex subunit beta-1 n=1 Tax=Carya illinoinensis TaxID=32201 RepID=UPI001C726D85|nr:AP-5 complex subunit beta-1 [Carya illinoinensis]
MTDIPPAAFKPVSPQDWETLIDDFQYGGLRRHKWTTLSPVLLDLALSSILKRDFPLKLHLLLFLEEFSDSFLLEPISLDRLLDSLRLVIQSPADGFHITLPLKDQFLVSTTSIFISLDVFNKFDIRYAESLVELLLIIVNRPNHGPDRQTRAVACECLRELERFYPCLLSDIAGHLWSLCQNERTHASQSYILLFTLVIHNIVALESNVSVLNTSVPLVPFNVPQSLLAGGSSNSTNTCLNYKELRRAMAFLLESPQVLTPCGMVEFMAMITPVAISLELQPSMLKVQFFGMVYSYNPILCHVVLMLYLRFMDAFDGQESEIARRLMLMSREAQHYLVFRLLALHWLMGFNELISSREVKKKKAMAVEMRLSFYPRVFDPLALKALKLDLLAFCSICIESLKSESASDAGKSVDKLFGDGLVSVSAFKWLPPGSTETAVAFRAFREFLIGGSSHSATDPSTIRTLLESTIFNTLQRMLVDMMLEYQRLVPVIVAFIDRLLGCQKHHWLGERLLQTFDENLIPKVKMDYRLVSCFPIFDRIAENNTIPPSRLLELLTKFMVFLVEKHGPDTGLKSWSQGSKVLGVCRTMLMHHHSSRLFCRLSRLLAFSCLYFPDLEVRDNARIYLRMLICIPGKKLRDMLNLWEQFLGISPSPHSSSFFNIQSPRTSHDLKKLRNVSSYVHLERVIPLLVRQSWSLSLSTFGVGNNKPDYLQGITDSELMESEERDIDGSTDIQILETERVGQPQEPLRVMDSKISEILGTLRRHFSCIPDYRHMPGLKVKIFCTLRFESEPFNRVWGVDSPASGMDGVDTLPAMYATVLNFSSSAPYGSIASYHIPFLLGEPPRNGHVSGESMPLDIVPVNSGPGEQERFRAPVTIELEPREPTPGLLDVSIQTNSENGQIIRAQLHGISVGIEDMFLRAIVPPDTPVEAMPGYYSNLFTALWEACGTPSNTGRETFPLKGGKGIAAISGTRSVKLLEVPATSLIRATERYLAPFVVSVIGEPLVNIVKNSGIIRDVSWKDVASDSSPDASTSESGFDGGPLHLTYFAAGEDESESLVSTSKKTMGCFHILIFLPPRFHLLFQLEVCDISTLVQIRTDHWPCLAYIDDYLEALYLA